MAEFTLAKGTGFDHFLRDGSAGDATQETVAASFPGYLDRSGFLPLMGRRDPARFVLDHEVPYQYTDSGPSERR